MKTSQRRISRLAALRSVVGQNKKLHARKRTKNLVAKIRRLKPRKISAEKTPQIQRWPLLCMEYCRTTATRVFRPRRLEPIDDVVDASGQRGYIFRINRGKRCDAQLVSTQFAVRFGIHDAISP